MAQIASEALSALISIVLGHFEGFGTTGLGAGAETEGSGTYPKVSP